MRKLFLLLAVFSALVLSRGAFAGDAVVTQKYEVVCMKCMAHHAAMGDDGGHGDKHAACAMSCSMKGTDLGLLDSKGNLYTPVKADFSTARDVIAGKAGETIELTGTIAKTKGVNYLVLPENSSKDGNSAKSDEKKDKDDN